MDISNYMHNLNIMDANKFTSIGKFRAGENYISTAIVSTEEFGLNDIFH